MAAPNVGLLRLPSFLVLVLLAGLQPLVADVPAGAAPSSEETAIVLATPLAIACPLFLPRPIPVRHAILTRARPSHTSTSRLAEGPGTNVKEFVA